MENNVEYEDRRTQTLYIVMIAILVIIIICAVIYLCRSSFYNRIFSPDVTPNVNPPQDKESYVISNGPVTQVKKDVYASDSGKILTNQFASKSFKDMTADIRNGTQTNLTDHEIDPWFNNKVDRMVSDGIATRDILKKMQSNNVLTKDEMKQVATKYHEGSASDLAMFNRVKPRPKKLIIAEGAVPVLDIDEKTRKNYPSFDRAKSNKMIAADRIVRVKPYSFDPTNPLGDGFHFTQGGFMKANDADKIVYNLNTDGDNSAKIQAIKENIYNIDNGKVSLKGVDGSITDYNVNISKNLESEKYLVDVNGSIIKKSQ